MTTYPAQLYGGTPPHAPTRTSLEAARRIAPYSERGRDCVLRVVQEHRGATCDEIEVLTGQKHQSAGARIRELVLQGYLVDSGRTRPTRAGRRAIIWVPA